jgi:hypothetical protein
LIRRFEEIDEEFVVIGDKRDEVDYKLGKFD